MLKNRIIYFVICAVLFVVSCTSNKEEAKEEKIKVAKGLYSFGPEVKSFSSCDGSKEYWVADSAKTLELAYHELGFEKPYVPVYVEVEFHYIKSDTLAASANYDSTMVVTKLLKISKEIPAGPCAQ